MNTARIALVLTFALSTLTGCALESATSYEGVWRGESETIITAHNPELASILNSVSKDDGVEYTFASASSSDLILKFDACSLPFNMSEMGGIEVKDAVCTLRDGSRVTEFTFEGDGFLDAQGKLVLEMDADVRVTEESNGVTFGFDVDVEFEGARL